VPVGFRPPVDTLAAVFICQECYKPFLTQAAKRQLQQHKDTQKQLFECNHHCGEFLQTETLLTSHVERHSSVLPGHLNCVHGECRHVFTNSTELRKHAAGHMERFCSECGKCFHSESQLHHETLALGNKSELPEPANDVADTQTHVQSAALDFVCDYCGSKFLIVDKFLSHVKLHKTDAPGVFKCLHENCPKHFSTAIKLRKHSETHSALYVPGHPFHCKVQGCLYAGKNRNCLLSHKKYVHGNNRFTCSFCGRHFRRASLLKKHLKHHETGTPGVLKCSFSGCRLLRFSSADDLKNHLFMHHHAAMAKNQAIAGGLLRPELSTS
jgi:Zinc finger, C2H2 type